MRTCFRSLVMIFLCAAALNLSAATKTWTGAVSSAWSEGGNWSGGVPAGSDIVSFPAGVTNHTVNVDAGGVSIQSITFGGSGYSIGGNSISLSAGIVSASSEFGGNTINAPLVLLASQTFGSGTTGTLGRLTINGAVSLGAFDLTLPMNARGITIGGAISGTGGVIGTGCCSASSYVSLQGNNSYTGATSVTGLYFEITGTQPDSSVTASSNFYGGGSWGNTSVGGTLYIGPLNGGTAILSTKNFQTVHAGFDINGGTAGSGYDQVQATGSVTISGELFLTVASTFTPSAGQQFTLISNDGVDAVNGTFSSYPEGQTFTLDGNQYHVTYTGGDGNDVVLVCTSAVKVWSGAVDSNWSTAGNWSGGVPAAGDNASFSDSATRKSITVDQAGVALKSMILAGGGYTIGGNSLTLSGGISTTTACCSANTLNSDLVLSAPITIGTGTVNGGGGRLTINGNISLGSNNLTLSTNGRGVTINGVISGSGGVNGTGCCAATSYVALKGNNTYTGPTSVTGLYYEISGSQPDSDVTSSSNLYGSGSWGNTNVGGTLWVGSFSTLGTAILATKNFHAQFLSADIRGTTPGTGYDQVQVTGAVTLGGDLVLSVSGFTPATGDQFILISNDGSDPASSVWASYPEGQTFTLDGSEYHVTYQGGDGNDVVLVCTSAAKVWSGAVDGTWSTAGNWNGGVPAAGDAVSFPDSATTKSINVDQAGVSLKSIVLAGGGYTIGGNSITLSGGISTTTACCSANTINSALVLAAPITIGAGTVNGGGGRLTINGNITLGGNNLTLSTSGRGVTINGVISGSGGVSGIGCCSAASYVALRGNNTYTGSTSITGLYYEISGSQPNSDVTSSSNLYGGGSWGNTVVGGTLWVGPFNGGTTILATKNFQAVHQAFDLNGVTPGTGHDQIQATGSVTLSGSLSTSLSFTPATGQKFLIIDNDGTDGVNGTYASMPEGSTFTLNGLTFSISYVGGSGNDVVLTAVTGSSNHAPAVVTPVADQIAEQGSAFVANVSASFGDADADALTYSASLWRGGALPSWISLNPTTGSFSGTPAGGDVGSFDVTVTATDSSGATASDTFHVTVLPPNNVPVANGQSVSTTEGLPAAITLTGSDADGDPISFNVATTPLKGSLSGTAPNLVYSPNAMENGSDSFTFTVNDGRATSAAATVSITITAVGPPATAAHPPYLVRNIDPEGSSSPASIAATHDGRAIFAATDALAGTEPWVSDGTTNGTIRLDDVEPGSGSSSPSQFLASASTTFFSATTAAGLELWKTGGTGGSTILVRDINGAGSSSPTSLTMSGALLFFAADDGSHGTELWSSDGTFAGTSMVFDANAAGASSPGELIDVNGTLYFAATDPSAGRELFKSDGTPGNSVMVKDIATLGASSSPRNLSNVGGVLYFTADSSGTDELWMSDGSILGTVRVKDINPTGSAAVSSVVAVGGLGLFRAADGTSGGELWKTNGTEGGTSLVKDINPGAATGIVSFSASNAVAIGSTLFFAADDGVHGVELWKSNGTESGTSIVSDVCPGSCSSNPTLFAVAGGRLWFRATNPYVGDELWVSDGTLAGTLLAGDVEPGIAGATPESIRGVGNLAFFAATTSAAGKELYAACATEAAQLVITGPSAAIAADTFMIEVKPADVGASAVPCYTGTIHFSSTDGSASLPADYTFVAGEGTHSFAVTLHSLGTRRITATDTVNGSIVGWIDVVIGASAATSTISAVPASIVADGAATSTITVQLKDSAGNNLTTGGASVALGTTAGALSVVTNNSDGSYTATLTAPAIPGSATISGTIDGAAMSSTATVTFTPGPAATLQVSAPANANAGSTFAVTVTALDAHGNTATSYGGKVFFSSSDTLATLPGPYVFTGGDAGVHAFSITLNSVGSISVTATDSVTSSITGSATVAAKGNTTTTVVSSANPSTAGESVTFTATVSSAFSGTIAGTVTFRDGAATIGTGTLSAGTASFSTSALSEGTHAITASFGGSSTFNASTSAPLTQTVNPGVPAAPGSFAASATSVSSVALSWGAVSGATSYEVYRSSMSGPFAPLSSTGATAAVDSSVAAGTTYLYKVRAIGPGGTSPFSSVDAATTVSFTDVSLTGVTVKAVHLTELRAAVNAMRAAAGLAPAGFTNDSPGGLPILAQHIVEIRTALDQARDAIGLPRLVYTDPTLTAGGSVIRAAHIEEPRAGTQ